MNKSFKGFFATVLSIFLLSSCDSNQKDSASENQPPNIIYILADDLGYGELGAYGQTKIETPNIDALVRDGMLFTQHYTSAPVCAPARYMLMTGKHSGHAYIRGNDEWRERGEVWDYHAMIEDSTLEGQRPIPSNTLLFPRKLKEAGYATGMVGKWGLGAPHTEAIPTKMGFDFFFGYNCQRQAHTYYPLHLYKNENRVHLNNDTIAPHTKLPELADPSNPDTYRNYNLNDYTPDLMYEEMIGFIKKNKQKPFFMYWASPIPHNPIQAPQRWVDHYIEKFGEELPYLGDKGYFPHPNPHAGYAAMISYLDENVGKLVRYLKEEGLYENTLIMFTSDNGPTFTGGTDAEYFDSAGPFENGYGRTKGFVYEGGIRVPMIASWPDKIAPGSSTDLVSVHYDVFATLADLLQLEQPTDTDGISFLPTLLGQPQSQQHSFLYWEFPAYGGQVAIRMGDWKVVRQHLKDEEQAPTLELYNLSMDPAESNNVIEAHPEIIQQAAEIFGREHQTPEIERFRIPLIEEGFLGEK